jgi:hypothetical protein
MLSSSSLSSLSSGGTVYTIPSRLYVLPGDVNPGGNSSECISGFMEGGNDFWLVGDPWFRAVYSVMDVAEHKYGMAANAMDTAAAAAAAAQAVGSLPH